MPAARETKQTEAASVTRTSFPNKLAIVLPTVCEAGNLACLLRNIRGAMADVAIAYEILVVDDDSRDGTEEIVRAITREDPRVRLLIRTGERGLSGAILHGWQNTDATILGVMDADGQHPPALLPDLVAAILGGGRDAAIGSRFAKGSRQRGWHPLRKLISALAILATRPLQTSALRIADPMSGYFLVRRSCVDNILFQPAGFKLLLEILARGRLRSVEEIPFVFGRRTVGKSKVCLRVALDYLTLLCKLYGAKWGVVRVPHEAPGD